MIVNPLANLTFPQLLFDGQISKYGRFLLILLGSTPLALQRVVESVLVVRVHSWFDFPLRFDSHNPVPEKTDVVVAFELFLLLLHLLLDLVVNGPGGVDPLIKADHYFK